MNFVEIKTPLVNADIAAVEGELGFLLPITIRGHYLQWRSGKREPSFFGQPLYACVHDVLPLIAEGDDDSTVAAYRSLVEENQFMPPGWLPFATDPGGDYFFVDCSKRDGHVALFRADYWPDDLERCRVDSGVDFVGFWEKLEDEPG